MPGLVIAYLSIKDIYPIFDRRLPDIPAFLFTYVLAAYVLIPTFLRFIRIFIKPKHIPLYCTTPDGFACDPINIGVVGTFKQLQHAMAEAGWHQADKRSLKTLAKMGSYILLRRSYNNAPFSSLFLFGRKQDVGFELPVKNSPISRHHVRFWAAGYPTSDKHKDNAYFWQRHYQPSGERIFWVGAVSLDIGLGIISHNAQISHRVHHDTNSERTLLIDKLRKASGVKHIYTKDIASPYSIKNRVFSSKLSSDGKIVICQL